MVGKCLVFTFKAINMDLACYAPFVKTSSAHSEVPQTLDPLPLPRMRPRIPHFPPRSQKKKPLGISSWSCLDVSTKVRSLQIVLLLFATSSAHFYTFLPLFFLLPPSIAYFQSARRISKVTVVSLRRSLRFQTGRAGRFQMRGTEQQRR